MFPVFSWGSENKKLQKYVVTTNALVDFCTAAAFSRRISAMFYLLNISKLACGNRPFTGKFRNA
jgi:hypothetical protein